MGPVMRSGPYAVGDKVLVVDSKNRRYLVTLREGGEFHTHAGVIPHASFVGQPEGTTLRSHLRRPLPDPAARPSPTSSCPCPGAPRSSIPRTSARC